MHLRPVAVLIATLGLSAGLVAGCGSSNSSVTVATVTETVPADSGDSTSTSSTHTSTSTHTATTPATTTHSTPTTAPSSATVPDHNATTAPSSSSGSDDSSLAAAKAKVAAQGYTPTSSSSYDPGNTLGVLVGAKTPGHELAFFFVRGKYIGTDTKNPSAAISVAGQTDTSVTLQYTLCCQKGTTDVTYALDNGKLEPQDPIPSDADRGTG